VYIHQPGNRLGRGIDGMRTWAVIVTLLALAPLGADRARAAHDPRKTPRIRASVVDVLPETAPDPALEDLVAKERYVDAFEHAVAALASAAAQHGPMDPLTLKRLERVGTVAFLDKDLRTAEETLDAALTAQRRVLGDTDPSIAETLYRRGYTARYREDRGLARRCYDEAWRILVKAPRDADALRAGLEQAEADWVRRDDLSAAIRWYRLALERRRRTLAWPSLAEADNLTWLGWSLSGQRRLDEAESTLLEARRELEALGLGQHTLAASIDHAVAEILDTRGDPDAAQPLYRRAASTFESARVSFLGGFSRRACPLDGFDAVAARMVRKNEGEAAWQTLERSRGAVFVDFATLRQWKDHDPEGFRVVDGVRREELDVKRRIGLARSSGHELWGEGTWELTLRSLQLRSRLNRLETDYLARNRPRVADLERVRAVLGPKDALVGWLDFTVRGDQLRRPEADNSQGWGYVLRRDGPLVWVPLWRGARPDSGSLHDAWKSIERAARWPLRVDSDPEILDRMRGWSRIYFDPLLPHLNGVERLIVEDTRVPLGPLVGPDGRFVGDAFEITYTPSIQALLLLDREGSRPMRARSVLSVAGPSDNAADRTVADLATSADPSLAFRVLRSSLLRDEHVLDRLPRLRFAQLEAQSIARHFATSTVLSGGHDLEHRLWEIVDHGQLGGFDVVHIATHTLTDWVPERCALALEGHPGPASFDDDGMLDLEELMLGVRPNAYLVTLSGCETTNAAGAMRGEALGFASTMLAAGARNVLSSVWQVDDQATTILMDRFYQNATGDYEGTRAGRTKEPLPLPAALREAQHYVRELPDKEGKRRFAHPVYWAGFILLGLPERDPALGAPAPDTCPDATPDR
jgi:CHAT domain-containing protein/tetratricopeptide (TPR) repeat protein